MEQPLWMSLEPRAGHIEILLSEPRRGTVLKARLPMPAHKLALKELLELIAGWYGRPLVAVLDADAQEVIAQPERWGVLLSGLNDLDVTVRWQQRRKQQRDCFFDGVSVCAEAKQLLRFCGVGQ